MKKSRSTSTIYCIGGSGMLGQEICKITEATPVSRSTGVDATKAMPFLKNKVIINCVGFSPLKLHHEKTIEVIKQIIKAKPKHIIHISAIGANKNSIIPYLKAKGQIEELLEQSNIPHFIIRPSVIDSPKSKLGPLRYLLPRVSIHKLAHTVKENLHSQGTITLMK